MEYVREVFGEPTPRVLAWSRTPKLGAAVGSDFILMERVNGVSLEDRWLNTFDADMDTALKDLILFDVRLHGRSLSGACSSKRMLSRSYKTDRSI